MLREVYIHGFRNSGNWKGAGYGDDKSWVKWLIWELEHCCISLLAAKNPSYTNMAAINDT